MKDLLKKMIKGNLKNRLYSLTLMGLGGLTVLLSGDGTFMALTILIGVPLFFSPNEWIMD